MSPVTKSEALTKTQPPAGVGIKEVASHLGTDPRSLRAFLRRTKRAVGRGTSYSWQSLDDPSVEQLHGDWNATKAEKRERPSTKK